MEYLIKYIALILYYTGLIALSVCVASLAISRECHKTLRNDITRQHVKDAWKSILIFCGGVIFAVGFLGYAFHSEIALFLTA